MAHDDVQRLNFAFFDDERGRVLPVEHSSGDFPFSPRRTFVICGVPPGKSRAEHTLTCDQVLVLVRGSVTVVTRRDGAETPYRLEAPGAALHGREGLWIALRDFAKDTVLLVFAARPYVRRG